MYTDAQFRTAWDAAYKDQEAARLEGIRMKLVVECIRHAQAGERPFKRVFITQNCHNGDDYQADAIVWARAKPEARNSEEAYYVMEMPEYEEAVRRLEAATS